jgi:hypothetical protein
MVTISFLAVGNLAWGLGWVNGDVNKIKIICFNTEHLFKAHFYLVHNGLFGF